MKAYCVKCRVKMEMKNPKPVTMKNNRPATQGICPGCGTKMFRIGSLKQAAISKGMFEIGAAPAAKKMYCRDRIEPPFGGDEIRPRGAKIEPPGGG